MCIKPPRLVLCGLPLVDAISSSRNAALKALIGRLALQRGLFLPLRARIGVLKM